MALIPDLPVIQTSERVNTMRVLGVVINSKLTMVGQIYHLSATYALSTNALRTPKTRDPQEKQIKIHH